MVEKEETAREEHKGGTPKGGKGGTQGKGKVKGKKGQRLNELREPPEEQWASGSWEQWSEQFWRTEARQCELARST